MLAIDLGKRHFQVCGTMLGAVAEAIAEAAHRPNLHYLHFVAVKDAEHQARAGTFRTHQCLVRQRTQLINALRGQTRGWAL